MTKLELGALRRLASQIAADAETKVKNPSTQMQMVRLAGSIKEGLSVDEEAAFRPASAPGRPALQGINLGRRTQALSMHRQGEPVSSIADALQAPSNEIALMIKVEQILNAKASGGQRS